MKITELFEGKKTAADLFSSKSFSVAITGLAKKFGLEYDGTKHNALFIKFDEDYSKTQALNFVHSDKLQNLVKKFGYALNDNDVDSRHKKGHEYFTIELSNVVTESKKTTTKLSKPQHPFSAKILAKGKDKHWPTLKGEIYEKDVLIGTFKRGAVHDGFHPPIEYKFRTERARDRFDDFADSLSIEETIEAIMEGKEPGSGNDVVDLAKQLKAAKNGIEITALEKKLKSKLGKDFRSALGIQKGHLSLWLQGNELYLSLDSKTETKQDQAASNVKKLIKDLFKVTPKLDFDDKTNEPRGLSFSRYSAIIPLSNLAEGKKAVENGVQGWYVIDQTDSICEGPFETKGKALSATKELRGNLTVEFGFDRDGKFTTLSKSERGW